MNTIDWNLARAFCATADASSLSAAARKISLTQPTLSRQVAELEITLEVALFDRIGKRAPRALVHPNHGVLCGEQAIDEARIQEVFRNFVME